ncbi:dynactin 3, p24 subunit [Rhynchophorus ferrugineus]|uniref:dynactin 3, p24 subunit n=1 Tax=Rhynchophorus ferrugineus TaxID=354439 RepID=UPI003FCD7665
MKMQIDDAEAIDILESRIKAIEEQVLPREAIAAEEAQQSVSDLLVETETMINSALSCRKPISSILKRMNDINDFLDPLNGEGDLEIEAKKHYLLQLYPEFMEILKVIQSFEGLIPLGAAGPLHRVSELSDKLHTTTADTLETYEECKNVTQEVLAALQKYNNVVNTVKLLFAQIDKVISDVEEDQKLALEREE